MITMKNSMKGRIFTYFCAFILPILSVINCEGWNAGSMSVKSCTIENYVFIEAANLVIGLLFLSSFMLFIPVLVYVLLVIASYELLLFLLKKVSNETKNNLVSQLKQKKVYVIALSLITTLYGINELWYLRSEGIFYRHPFESFLVVIGIIGLVYGFKLRNITRPLRADP
jgi:small-conductance mechanosensitive channel